jgi:hypothetical protein
VNKKEMKTTTPMYQKQEKIHMKYRILLGVTAVIALTMLMMIPVAAMNDIPLEDILTEDDLIITSNKDSVTRSKDFAVTIQGHPNTEYVFWVKDTSFLVAGEVPAIKDGQQGVTKGSALANAYVFSGVLTVGGDVPQVAGVSSGDQYAMVTTNDEGKRTISFRTTQMTKDQTYTIRVQEYVLFSHSKYDEVEITIEKGEVTIDASGMESYYLGEEITLSGINTDSSEVYLFMTGPNLWTSGANLQDPMMAVVDFVPDTFVRQSVKADDTWEYKWDTSNLGLAPNCYTIYAVSSPRDANDLYNAVYATLTLDLRKPFITTSVSSPTVEQGERLFIRGVATGDPSPGVAIWILGDNFYARITEIVYQDASYELELTPQWTYYMAPGEYNVVVQHPMTNNMFNIIENVVGSISYVQTRDAAPFGFVPQVGATAFVIIGPGSLQGADAVNALIHLLSLPTIDDTYGRTTFIVEDTSDEPPVVDPKISLLEGWNFISTPKRLAEGNNTAVIFSLVDTGGRSIFLYNAGDASWVTMNATSPVRPLDGIWIYSNTTMEIPLIFDSGAVQTPPTKVLSPGWNAIGFSGPEPATARDTLISVQSRWTQLLGWNTVMQRYDTAIVTGGSGAYSDSRLMYPMQGYWVFMTDGGILAALG